MTDQECSQAKSGPIVAFSIMAGLVAFVWFYILGGILLVSPDTIVTQKEDVLFGSDAATRINRLTGTYQPTLLAVSHPLYRIVWGHIGQALRSTFEKMMPPKEARVLAARLMVEFVAAAGVGALVFAAGRCGTSILRLAILLPIYLVFTANVVVVLPDYFGLSAGLLSASVCGLLPGMSSRVRLGVLFILGVLITGTTVTNAVFIVLCLICLYWESHVRKALGRVLRDYRMAAGAVLLVAAATALLLWYCGSRMAAPTVVSKGLTLRLIRDPLSAARYAGLSLVFPAVGPHPFVKQSETSLISYNPFGLGSFSLLSGSAGILWVVVLGYCWVVVFRDSRLRMFGCLVSLWFAFNVVFHNLWADEFFLFTPHWSWALMLIVFLGSRKLPAWSLLALATLTVPGQIDTLLAIRSAVLALGG